MSDGEKERFEYYKELRKSPTGGISSSPFWMYNVYDIDVSQEKDELGPSHRCHRKILYI